jgi:hypothetical protein
LPAPAGVEFRNRTWMTKTNRAEILGSLTAHELPYVCVNVPQGYPLDPASAGRHRAPSRDALPWPLRYGDSHLQTVRLPLLV